MPRLTKESKEALQALDDEHMTPVLECVVDIKKAVARFLTLDLGREKTRLFMTHMDENFHFYVPLLVKDLSVSSAIISLKAPATAIRIPVLDTETSHKLDHGPDGESILWMYEMQYYAYSLHNTDLRNRFLRELGLPLGEPIRRSLPRKPTCLRPKV